MTAFEPRMVVGPMGPWFEFEPGHFLNPAQVVTVDIAGTGKGEFTMMNGAIVTVPTRTADILRAYFAKTADIVTAKAIPGMKGVG